MVELRLDYAHEVDVAGVLDDRRCPVVVACRPSWEGGHFAGSEEERRRLLALALKLGAEYVDLEWRAGFEELISSDTAERIVLSSHNFDGVPDDLDTRARAMRATGAGVVKIAVQVETLSDLVTLREFSQRNRLASDQQVVIGMGPAGIASRILPDQFGSAWTYAGEGVAPGQVTLSRMLDEFHVRRLTSEPELYGVLGNPLVHSLSPIMHNAGFAEVGRDAVYLPFEARDVDDFETFAKAFQVRGASVTAPFKGAVMSKVSTADDLCRRVGALNTLRMESDGWHGRNTDVPGFLEPLSGRADLSKCRAIVLGSGGAARGVVIALAGQGSSVTVCGRNPERVKAVASLVDAATSAVQPERGAWDLLVNTTPVGTYPDVAATPLGAAELDDAPDGAIVYDLVYNPPVTRLMAAATAAGCTAIGGLDMLVAQAELQFAWWTGTPPLTGTFRRAADRGLAEVPK